MNEIIKPHSFEDAKQHIHAFSGRTSSNLGLEKVNDSGGLFGWFEHTVTGTELNKVTAQVQDYLIKFNELHIDFIKEFGQVYKALESLDKEYIPAILSAIKGAETASNQAKAAQIDIKKTIEAQKKIITVLERHKEKLDKLNHLENIDEIWNDIRKLNQEISAYKNNFESAQKQVLRLEGSLKAVQKYADSLLNYEHLEDVDEIWERVSSHNNEISKILIQLKKTNTDIQDLEDTLNDMQSVVDEIRNYEHLKDIDHIWNDVESYKENIVDIGKKETKNSSEITSLRKETKDLIIFKSNVEKQRYLLNIDEIWERVSLNNDEISEMHIQLEKTNAGIQDLEDSLNGMQSAVDEIHNFEHLKDINHIWDDVARCKENIVDINERETKNYTEITSLQKEAKNLITFKINLEKQKHFEQIDAMWNDVQTGQKNISNLLDSVNKLSADVDSITDNQHVLLELRDNLERQEHFSDIDLLWNNTDVALSEIKKKSDKFDDEIQMLRENMKEEHQSYHTVITDLKNRLNFAYAISGGVIGLGIIELILNVLGIL